jgi:threonylcarbamoyladenosine tRNA methylthiotransferase MtaB
MKALRMKIAVCALGCKVSQYDAGGIVRRLTAAGFEAESASGIAGLGAGNTGMVIVNACAVTGHSAAKAQKLLNAVKRENPGIITAVTGCLSRIEADLPADIAEPDENKLLERIISLRSRLNGDKPAEIRISPPPRNTRAFLKITDGCDRSCAYCIIPQARGRIVTSLPAEEIERYAAEIAATGQKEIVLAGINLARYKDRESGLIGAVNAASAPEGILRVRLSSLEPERMLNAEFFDLLRANPKICPSFHLSLQSGCDRTLKRMNRLYDTARFSEILALIRERFENPGISTDVIVGFDEESDADFAESLQFVKECGFAKIHVFTYSPRPGTPASLRNLPPLPDQIKKRRADILHAAAKQSRAEFLQKQIGQRTRLIIERRKSPDFVGGVSDNGVYIRLYGVNLPRYAATEVRITGSAEDHCAGEIV